MVHREVVVDRGDIFLEGLPGFDPSRRFLVCAAARYEQMRL